jgi:hypothetical protein
MVNMPRTDLDTVQLELASAHEAAVHMVYVAQQCLNGSEATMKHTVTQKTVFIYHSNFKLDYTFKIEWKLLQKWPKPRLKWKAYQRIHNPRMKGHAVRTPLFARGEHGVGIG